jgi:CheY-like chemotaxis protein
LETVGLDTAGTGPQGVQMRNARVFLVEDEALIRLMLAEMIEELGHQIVAEAGSIESALPRSISRSWT